MKIDQHDIQALLTILAYFILTPLVYALPLQLFFKNWARVIRFVIPTSLSLQMLFAYPFYCTGRAISYPLFYLIFIIIINLISYILLRSSIRKDISNVRNRKWPKPTTLALIAITIISVLYNRYYDSLVFIRSGSPDALTHALMIRQIIDTGRLGLTYYAPGFHLLLLPLTSLISVFDISRFSGPPIGLLVFAQAYLLMQPYLKSSLLKLLFVFLFLCFVFNRMALQTIGFFPSSISFIYFITFIYLFTPENDALEKYKYYFFLLLTTIGLALSVPYVFVQMLPIPIIIFIATHSIVNKQEQAKRKKALIACLAAIIVGLCLSFLHVFLQTKVITKGGGFPIIATYEIKEDKIISSSNYTESSAQGLSGNNTLSSIDKRLSANDIYKTMIRPLLFTGMNMIGAKDIVQPTDLVSIGGYIWLALLIIILPWSLKNKHFFLASLIIASIVCGISSQFGILEMSYYRGRSGWYYMSLCPLIITLLFGHFYKKKYLPYTIGLVLVLWLSSIVKPPVFPRLYYTEVDGVYKKIIDETPNNKIAIMDTTRNLTAFSSNFVVLPVNEKAMAEADKYKQSFLFFEKIPYPYEKGLSTMIFSPEKEIVLFNPAQIEKDKASYLQAVQKVKASQYFEDYSLYWENSNIEVYSKTLK